LSKDEAYALRKAIEEQKRFAVLVVPTCYLIKAVLAFTNLLRAKNSIIFVDLYPGISSSFGVLVVATIIEAVA